MSPHPDENGGTELSECGARQKPHACFLCAAAPQADKDGPAGAALRRNDILSMLSHDIMTPLSIIIAHAELLAENGAVSAGDYQDAIEQIKRAAHSTSALVEDFLTILRLESGEIRLEAEPVPPSSLVSTAVGSLRHLAVKKSASISVDIPDGLPAILVDEDRFGRVITNVVTNTLRHCQYGVNVRISARTAEPEGGKVMLELTDDGPGIPQDELAHIFEWDSIRKSKSRAKGHGLGLMIVKTITELHGGTVEIISAAGSGTTVRLALPAARSTP